MTESTLMDHERRISTVEAEISAFREELGDMKTVMKQLGASGLTLLGGILLAIVLHL